MMIGTEEARKKLNNASARRIRALCEQDRIPGAKKIGNTWMLPDNPVVVESDRKRPSKIKMKKGKKK